jgi:glycogen debranching enzyme
MPETNLIDEGYARAIQVLQRNATEQGFVASSALGQYRAIWARDACITAVGAYCTGDSKLIEAARNSLVTFVQTQAPLGQVAGAYWPQRSYWDWQEAGCTDATAWFVIAVWYHFQATSDRGFLSAVWESINKAITWLQYQDVNNFGLIDSPNGADWMDATLSRGGKVFYINCLYYKAVLCAKELAAELGEDLPLDPDAIKESINLLFWPDPGRHYAELLSHVPYPSEAVVEFPRPGAARAYHFAASTDRRHYLSHVSGASFVDLFDTLSHCLAILWGIADEEKASRILDYCREVGISQPYPARSLSHPISARNDKWGMRRSIAEACQPPSWRNRPYRYHNAGVWPFVGGFYVLALARAGRGDAAWLELERLAEANRLGRKQAWEFSEWLHGRSGRPNGAAFQSWSAGMYIAAYKLLAGGRIIV